MLRPDFKSCWDYNRAITAIANQTFRLRPTSPKRETCNKLIDSLEAECIARFGVTSSEEKPR